MVTKKTAMQRREDILDSDAHTHMHEVKNGAGNASRIKLDHLRTLSPLTENQALFLEAYKRGDFFIGCFGSAGTGKTTLPLYKAIEEVLMKDNPFKQVVVVRSVVPGRSVGFLPGTLEEKEEIYELPYKEICEMLFSRKDAWQRLKEAGHARFLSTTSIRGISIDDSIIIVDEIQNCNFEELSSVLTRTGHRSKIIFCGDFRQNDLIYNRNDTSGFHKFREIARSMSSFTEINYTPDDIIRSSLTKEWIIACEKYSDSN